jgi:hypothetical protein
MSSSTHSFAQYYNNPMMSDLTVLSGDHRFIAHRMVLAIASGLYAKNFEEFPLMTELTINGVVPEAVREMLSWMYRKTVDLEDNWQIVGGVIRLSLWNSIDDLFIVSKNKLEAMVTNTANFLTLDNFVDIGDVAAYCGLKSVNQLVAEFCLKKKAEIIESLFTRYESVDGVKRVLAVMKPSQSDVIEWLTPDVIANSGHNPKALEALINLDECSLEDVLALMRTELFRDRDLIAISQHKLADYKSRMEAKVQMMSDFIKTFNGLN